MCTNNQNKMKNFKLTHPNLQHLPQVIRNLQGIDYLPSKAQLYKVIEKIKFPYVNWGNPTKPQYSQYNYMPIVNWLEYHGCIRIVQNGSRYSIIIQNKINFINLENLSPDYMAYNRNQ